MLQYIINSSSIWLTGLIVFDVFLRREAQHSYNRFYLLAILFAGALIPLWTWDYDGVVFASGISEPIVQQSAAIKANIVSSSEQSVLGWEQWLTIIYLTGVSVMLLFMVKELWSIYSLYRSGIKSKDGTWTIIETGKNTSPFSAFRYVFISSKDNYTDEELAMILAHEEQHGHLLHFVDVLLTRISCVVFWFNPLVYLLERRLLLVHEYQADLAVNKQPSIYGSFLIEQSVLGTAPVLAHSFIRSPLKKRIHMLTRKTTTIAKSKQALVLPVIILALLCFTNNAFPWQPPQKDGNKITYRGNVIEFPEGGDPDTMMTKDPSTGEMQMVITRREPRPYKINGSRIYNEEELNGKGPNGRYCTESALNAQVLKDYLLVNLGKEIKKLPDGDYRITLSDIVVDDKGAVVFFQFDGLMKTKKVDNVRQSVQMVDDKLNSRFANRVAELVNDMPKHEPAVYDGEEVNSVIGNWAFYNSFTVKDKKIVAL